MVVAPELTVAEPGTRLLEENNIDGYDVVHVTDVDWDVAEVGSTLVAPTPDRTQTSAHTSQPIGCMQTPNDKNRENVTNIWGLETAPD